MKKIELTQGHFAIVDDCDFEYLNQWKWCVDVIGKIAYAKRTDIKNGRRKTVRMHQAVASLMGLDLNLETDHINRNGLDNRRSNLRSVTHKQSMENRGLQKNNTSGLRGVTWDKRRSKWKSQISHNGKTTHLGYFHEKEAAAAAYQEARDRLFTHHGEA